MLHPGVSKFKDLHPDAASRRDMDATWTPSRKSPETRTRTVERLERHGRDMTTKKQARLHRLARDLLIAAGDEDVAIAVFKKELDAWRKMSEAPIERPQLKFELQRAGGVLKYWNYTISPMLAELNQNNVPDYLQPGRIRVRYPDISKQSIMEGIDGSSNCQLQINKERISR
jgi:hypothetical protein